MNILLADGGSTKTDWALLADGRLLTRFTTGGVNPSLMADETIGDLLRQEVLPCICSVRQESGEGVENQKNICSFSGLGKRIDEVRFYGAGCRPEQEERMSRLLQKALNACRAIVASDLLGAAHALCGENEGIVCILGTGSGSAVYDGSKFLQSTPSLGYVLGDEGSGAVLGRRLLSDVLKSQLPPHLCRSFVETYGVDAASAIQSVYREAAPNRYLAGFTRFLSAHRDEESIRDLLLDEFRRFFLRNIRAYNRPDLSVNFVGSIAVVFSEELEEAARSLGFTLGRVVHAPLDALLERSVHSK